jgi:hypothetical protein
MSKHEHTFHQSQLEQFSFCLERGRALYAEEIPAGPPTDSMVHGSATHAAIEACLHNVLDYEEPLSLDTALETYHRYVDEVGEIVWIKHTPEKLEVLAKRALTNWYRYVLPVIEPFRVEWKFDEVLLHEDSARKIYLAGQVDCHDIHGTVWDWKTAGREFTPWERQRWAIQPTVYSYAVHEVTEQTWPITFRYAVLLNSGKYQEVDVVRSREHVGWLKHKVLTLAKTLEAGEKPLPLSDDGWWCAPEWCPNWSNCKGKFHEGDDWKTVTK